MSRDISPDLNSLRLFLTEPHQCSYLPNQMASTSFVDPEINIDNQLYSRLTELGFRRSGHYIYAPRCESCNACISVRIRVREFRPNRRQKRCAKRNSDLTVHAKQQVDRDEHYPLYESYINNRHMDGDMYPANRQQYNDFISNMMDDSQFLEFRLQERLVAAAVTDRLDSGLSAIYTYFDPSADKRSLGTFAILSQISLARELGLTYLYLGYWVKSCRKMDYKTTFRPLEMLSRGRWVLVN